MPSRYQYGIEELNERRPNYPVFNDVEPILNQLQKYWLLRERFNVIKIRGGARCVNFVKNQNLIQMKPYCVAAVFRGYSL